MLELKSKEPISMFIDITPKLAVYMLETNKQNRKISESTLKSLVRKMKINEFKVTGQSISFNVDGILQDGQHRLQAIIESNTTQKICVCFGLPNDSWNDYDIGKKRTGGDNLAAIGAKYSNELSGAINVWYTLKNKQYSNKGFKFNNKQIVDIYLEKRDLFDRITQNIVQYHTKNDMLFSKSKIIGFAYYLHFDCNYPMETIQEFYDYFYNLKETNITEFNDIRKEIISRKSKQTNQLTDFETYSYLTNCFLFYIGEIESIPKKIKENEIKQIKISK